MLQNKPALLNNRGLTILELLVAMGIFLLLIGSVITLLSTSFHSKDIIYEQLLTQSQGRKVVQDFVNEIRSATYASTGAYPISEASSTEIIFYTNMDADSLVERVRYFLSNAKLQKGVLKPAGNPPTYTNANELISLVAESVTLPSSTLFSYYDQNYYAGSGSALAAPVAVTQVRLVEIHFQLDRAANTSPSPFTIAAKTELRNLKGN